MGFLFMQTILLPCFHHTQNPAPTGQENCLDLLQYESVEEARDSLHVIQSHPIDALACSTMIT